MHSFVILSLPVASFLLSWLTQDIRQSKSIDMPSHW